ncbi:biosynthetic arginine decarboxylase [Paraliomyxa miuraensis]|uniref:biosynthetic arginine decarboxylase n=1 Tax=Paraliomyxa miuraensis TaxID=376150 RepID=UPI00224FC7E3|nr:biosynthetic arginine decarboxylase [Paraliomyxa miuraensis]MCX4243524.1 biosynthetic arginine decarboxylase [Paraliomyxa miuraensis]
MDTPNAPYAMEVSLKRYGVDRWGEEFLSVNEKGHLVYRAPGLAPVDLHRVAEYLEGRGIRTPFIVRFPTVVQGQMRRLQQAFARAINENGYKGGYFGVLPIKVNQRRVVIDALVRATAPTFGLEAGSKPEMLIAMSRAPNPDAPLLINGFKDRDFMRMAYHAAELGHRVIVIIESIREVERFTQVGREEPWRAIPQLGVRAKLYTRGSGRWQSSGGETSKFGLTTTEILDVVRTLKEADRLDQLVLLHFHIGSQITRIKRIKQAVREAARLFCSLQLSWAPNMHYLDLGGGMGVDYDGSRTSYPSSANYTMEEYASQAVFEVSEVVEQTGAQEPTLITESGRAMVARHAVTITDLREVQGALPPEPPSREDEHRIITALRETLDHLSPKNYEEYFHDAVDFRDEALELFATGYLTLEDRADAEALFLRVRTKVAHIVDELKRPSEEIVEYLEKANRKYLANFSIFQSLPDAWSVDQVFPAAPLSRHGERPTLTTEIVDITCDSDGCVTSFAHPDENMRFLPLHERRDKNEKYYLGFFMTGAYQDSLANQHNLFSRIHDVVVRHPDDERPHIAGVNRFTLDEELVLDVKIGATNEDALQAMDFDIDDLLHELRERHVDHATSLGEQWALGLLQSYPYLTRA